MLYKVPGELIGLRLYDVLAPVSKALAKLLGLDGDAVRVEPTKQRLALGGA